MQGFKETEIRWIPEDRGYKKQIHLQMTHAMAIKRLSKKLHAVARLHLVPSEAENQT